MPVNPLRKIAALRSSPVEYHCEKCACPEGQKRFSFGRFGFEHEVEFSSLSISVKSDGGLHQYKRTYRDGEKPMRQPFPRPKARFLSTR
jgi:hypothetical protein